MGLGGNSWQNSIYKGLGYFFFKWPIWEHLRLVGGMASKGCVVERKAGDVRAEFFKSCGLDHLF